MRSGFYENVLREFGNCVRPCGPHRKNLIFLDVLNFNGFLTLYFPLKELSPTPLHYPLAASGLGIAL